MPYIAPKKRVPYGDILIILASHIKSLPMEEQDGNLNFFISRLLREIYPRRYFHYNRAIGLLESIKHEFYRTIIGPYEDEKKEEHGDV